MVVILSKSIVDTGNVARRVLDYIQKNKKNGGGVSGAMVVGLYGELGAGKTAFVKEMASVIGIKEDVTSPTFVISKRYEIKNLKFKNLIHIDAYRLKNGEDLKQLGWEEIIKNPDNIILIEWTERVKEILPNDMLKIYFEFVDEETRRIEMNF